MKKLIKKFIKDRHPLLLFYHRLKAFLAVTYYMNPSKKLKVIGVTGTNGKTTTVNLIASLLEESGHKVGFTSTLRYKIGDRVWSNKLKMTTQSPFFLQKMLKQMVREGCEYAIVEVTSHAVDQHRVKGINFDVAVITNLTGDHIEYHGSFDEYMHAKGKFMGSVYSMKRKKDVPKVVIINGDDVHYDYFSQFKGDLNFVYGLESKHCTVKGRDVLLGASSTKFHVDVPNDDSEIETELLGEFNTYNVMAAISVGISQGVALKSIANAFKNIKPIGGRLEPVNVGQDFSVIVDYAHTAEAYESLCAMFKPLTKGKLIFVGGATGGGRDKLKRPDMGAAVEPYADVIIFTDDDPYTEDRWSIIDQLASGVKRKENVYKIVDREEAIRLALTLAEKDDTVLIAGKGGEEVIVIGEELIPYDDRQVCRKILSEEIFSHMTL